NGTTVSGATLNVNGVTTLEDVTLSSAGVLQGTATAQQIGRATRRERAHTVATAEPLKLAGKITGSGGLDKAGVRTGSLSGANTKDDTGYATGRRGTRELRDGNALGASRVGNGTTVSGATLNVNGVTTLEDVTLSSAGVLQGTATAQ